MHISLLACTRPVRHKAAHDAGASQHRTPIGMWILPTGDRALPSGRMSPLDAWASEIDPWLEIIKGHRGESKIVESDIFRIRPGPDTSESVMVN